MGATLLQFRNDALNRLASHKGPQPSAPTTQTPPLPQQWAGYTPTPQSNYNYFQNAPVQGPTDPSQIRAYAEAPVLAPPAAAPVSQPSYTPQATGKLSSSPIAAGKLSTSARGYASGGQVRSALPDNIRALAEETVKTGPVRGSMKDPKALRKAIMTAKSIASLVDPKFSRVPLPDIGVSAPEVYVPEHSPAMHEAFGLPMPKGYAAGGEIESLNLATGGFADEENPYTQPNDLGLYSHAAATAAELPQERGTPEQFRGMLLNKGVKPAELEWSGYDEAFADQPQVTRQQIAEHFHANRPPVQEKRFQELPSVNELNALRRKHLDEVRDYQAKVRETPDFDPGGERWKRLQYWHQAEKRELLSKYDRPHHETYTIPGGENYREILLKHGGEEGFKGIPVHFKGEPNILTSLMVKDRQDTEGDKVLHLDELQSDWAQRGRREGFESKASQDYKKYVHDLTERFFDNAPKYFAEQGYDDDEIGRALRQYHSDPASMAAVLGESDKHKELVLRDHAEPNGPHGRAPYVTKTEDWVDLGLKKALQEAAEGGHNKLAWSPGKTIADRYDLTKHVGAIQHEKNDDGTHNIVVYAKNGETLLDRDDMEPQEIADYLGKGIAERIVNGEGETGQKEYERHRDAMEDYDNFLLQAADQYAKAEMQGADIPEDRREHMHGVLKKVALNGLQPYSRNRGEILDQLGLRDREYELRSALEDARYDLDLAPEYSPYRDWRHLKTDDLHVGEKWPFEMYDRMIPKRLLKLAKQHDPEAKLEKSVISHKADHDMYEFYPEDEYGNASDEPANPHPMTQTELHAIRITPKMRESILKKGFPAYAQGGEVEAYADGGEIDPELFKQYMKRIHTPLSEDPESVRKALQISSSYRAPVGMETGVGSLYNIKQSLPAKDVKATIGDIPGITMKKPVKKSWEDFYQKGKGGVFINMGGDLSNFGRLTHINDKELAWPVDLHAGTKFMLEPNPKYVWGNAAGHSTAFENKIRSAERLGKDVYGIFSPMGPSAVNSSHNMFDALMAQIPNAGIDKKHLREFDTALKRGEHLDASIRKDPKKLAAHLDALKAWPGLENAKEASEYARPEAGNLTGTHRTMIVKFMDKADWLKKGFPEVGITRAAITDPELKGVGGNKIGHRIVKLSSEELPGAKRAFEHSTYPTYTGGEYEMDVPLVQRHYAAPDVVEEMIKKPTKAGQIVHPYSEDTLGRATARKLFEEQKQMQPINQRFLDSVMLGMENQKKYGFKKGGSVRKALMIAKTAKKK